MAPNPGLKYLHHHAPVKSRNNLALVCQNLRSNGQRWRWQYFNQRGRRSYARCMATGRIHNNNDSDDRHVPDGLGVRIPGFHPGGPGSIPGLGVLFEFV